MASSSYIVKNPKETEALACELSELLIRFEPRRDHAFTIALEGDLGAGKTFFTQSLVRALGVREKVHSPTFIFMKRYPLKKSKFKNLWHMDFYRLEKISELSPIGFHEVMANPESIAIIEWADKIKKYIPRDALRISIEHRSRTERMIIFRAP